MITAFVIHILFITSFQTREHGIFYFQIQMEDTYVHNFLPKGTGNWKQNNTSNYTFSASDNYCTS